MMNHLDIYTSIRTNLRKGIHVSLVQAKVGVIRASWNAIKDIGSIASYALKMNTSMLQLRNLSLAGQLVDLKRPGEFSQALLELCLTLCTPTSPNCSECPVSAQCHALSLPQQGGLVADYPLKVEKAKRRDEFSAVCVVEISESEKLLECADGSSRYLLVKRLDEGLLARVWSGNASALRRRCCKMGLSMVICS